MIRWWVFEGDAWQIKRDGSGMPTGLDQAIYADLESTAKRACEASGTRSLHVRLQEQQCAAQLLEKAVKKISRTDVAAIHGRTLHG